MKNTDYVTHDSKEIIRNSQRPFSKKIIWLLGCIAFFLASTFFVEQSKEYTYRNLCQKVVEPINPKGAIITIVAVSNGESSQSIRVDYEKKDGSSRTLHWITCYFSDSYGSNDYALKSVRTESDILSSADVFFLNRFILYPVPEEKMRQKTQLYN